MHYDSQVTQLNEFQQNLDLDSPVQYPTHIKMDFYMKLPSMTGVGSG